MSSSDIAAWAKSISNIKIGDYCLEHFIGCGKIGFVYKGHRLHAPGQSVAIKLVFDPADGWDVELNKVHELSDVDGVVRFYNVTHADIDFGGRMENALVTTWQFIDGPNLNNFINDGNACTVSFAVAVLIKILWVLAACESTASIKRHGDLHAGNILIGRQKFHSMIGGNCQHAVYVSDFGYGATGGLKKPKNDYDGLKDIFSKILSRIDISKTNESERRLLKSLNDLKLKFFGESHANERVPPLQIFHHIQELQHNAVRPRLPYQELTPFSVGQLQSSEMFGEHWDRWKKLFVASIPARSQIFQPGMVTVITGPRGCGKTMLFRRLSKRLMMECGPIEGIDVSFIGIYVNANDIADAFPRFPKEPQEHNERALVAFLNICILSDILAVQAAWSAQGVPVHEKFLSAVDELLPPSGPVPVIGEDRLEHVRARLEAAKWQYLNADPRAIAAGDLGAHLWFERFIRETVRPYCDWVDDDAQVYLLVDDYTVPRIKLDMQKILNRVLFRRSDQYISKIATEAATTFVATDTSGKNFQINDDYALIDIASESLSMSSDERSDFLGEVFRRRLNLDSRIPEGARALPGLLGETPLSFNEFAKRIRDKACADPQYHGHQMVVGLWSGDTRTMLQVVQELVDVAYNGETGMVVPVPSDRQHHVLVNRGAQWLHDLTHFEPSDPSVLREDAIKKTMEVEQRRSGFGGFVNDSYGAHLKAIVEAFRAKAKIQLLGPTYKDGAREIAKSAFRIEIIDQFRLDGMADKIYRDLIRYGVFLRDGRGKSFRGALVPRLFLRRLLLPYCSLVPSAKDSVKMTNDEFRMLLLAPDRYLNAIGSPRRGGGGSNEPGLFDAGPEDKE